MNFFKKVFGSKSQSAELQKKKNPDNTRLIYLLNIFSEHSSDDNYKLVVEEITSGNAYLLFPSINNDLNTVGWTTVHPGETLKFTSIYDFDGLKAIAVFTDENSLLKWASKATEYTSVPIDVLPDICGQLGIVRIVINSGQKNMFVLERRPENLDINVMKETTMVKIGPAPKPLDRQAVARLTKKFENVSTLIEAYQYGMLLNGELSIVLGCILSVETENSRAALYNAINDALQGVTFEIPLNVIVLSESDTLELIKEIPDSLIYSKQVS